MARWTPHPGGPAARGVGVLAILALAGCAPGAPAPPSPSPVVSVTATTPAAAPGTLGFSPGYRVLGLDDETLARQLDLDVGAGARWWRVDLDWSRIEAVPGDGDWEATDRVITAVRSRGLQVVALPGYAPDWAVDAVGAPNAAAYAAFVARAVARYAPAGVRTWELWNEPNLRSAWGAPPDPVAYGALLRAAAAAVTGVDPGATVLSGGLAPVATRGGSSMAMAGFLAAVAQGGQVPGLDGVAVHAYVYPELPRTAAPGPRNVFSQLPALHRLSLELGAPTGALWATEVGAPTGDDPRAVTPRAQAETLRQAHALLAAPPWSGPVLVYSDRDLGGDPADRETSFGLLDEQFEPKPAWEVFGELAGAP